MKQYIFRRTDLIEPLIQEVWRLKPELKERLAATAYFVFTQALENMKANRTTPLVEIAAVSPDVDQVDVDSEFD